MTTGGAWGWQSLSKAKVTMNHDMRSVRCTALAEIGSGLWLRNCVPSSAARKVALTGPRRAQAVRWRDDRGDGAFATIDIEKVFADGRIQDIKTIQNIGLTLRDNEGDCAGDDDAAWLAIRGSGFPRKRGWPA